MRDKVLPKWARFDCRVLTSRLYETRDLSRATKLDQFAEEAATASRNFGRDSVEHLHALECAANEGDRVSAFRFALKTLGNKNSEVHTAALDRLEKLAAEGFSPAVGYMALLECSGKVPRGSNEALRARLELAASMGNEQARVLLIARLALGIGGVADLNGATAQARLLGLSDPLAAETLLEFFRSGAPLRLEYIDDRVRKVVKNWFELSERLDRAFQSMCSPALQRSTVQDAADIARLAADEQFTDAMYLFGVCRAWGLGVDADPLDGIEWLDRAAGLGLEVAIDAAAALRTLIRTRDESLPLGPDVVARGMLSGFDSDREWLDYMLYQYDGGKLPVGAWFAYTEHGGCSPWSVIEWMRYQAWTPEAALLVDEMIRELGTDDPDDVWWFTSDWCFESNQMDLEHYVLVKCARKGVALARSRLRSLAMTKVWPGDELIPIEIGDYISLLRTSAACADASCVAEVSLIERLGMDQLKDWDEVSFEQALRYQIGCLNLPSAELDEVLSDGRERLADCICCLIQDALNREVDGWNEDMGRFAHQAIRSLLDVRDVHEFIDAKQLVELLRVSNLNQPNDELSGS